MKLKFLPILLVMLLLTGCSADASEDQTLDSMVQSESQQESEEISQEAEQEPYVVTFEANTIEGEAFSSACFADSKLTMINVWATYCNPCLSEMPDLGEIAGSYDSADFQMIGIISDVVEDAGEEEITIAKDLIAETNAAYPHLLLNQSLYTNLVSGVTSVPTTFFVNQEGEMMGYALGAQSKETWESIINELLEEIE